MSDLEGVWEGGELVVQLVAEGPGYAGSVTLRGRSFPLRAGVGPEGLRGTFEAEGAEFPFTAVPASGGLVLSSGGASYRLARRAPPAGVTNPVAAPAAPPDSEGGWYRHATGAELRLPPGWRAQSSPLGVQLVPPDGAANEIYAVTGQPAPGIARPDDPRVQLTLEALLASQIPFLERAGAPEADGDGARFRWRGRHALTGAEIAAVVTVRLLDGNAVGFLAVGECARVEPRHAAVAGVARSLRMGQGQRDPRLVGSWHHWSYRGSSGLTGASYGTETRRQVLLAADGSAAEASSVESSGFVSGSAGWAGQGQEQRRGTWTAGDGTLFMRWNDGTSAAFQYQVSGVPGARRVLLVAPGMDKPLEWNEQPVGP